MDDASDTHEAALTTTPAITVEKITLTVTRTDFATTPADAYRCLRDYEDHRSDKQAWAAPLGIGLTILLTLTTATPHDFAGVEKDVWMAVYVIALAACVLWLGVALYRSRTTQTIDEVIQCLQESSQPPTAPPLAH